MTRTVSDVVTAGRTSSTRPSLVTGRKQDGGLDGYQQATVAFGAAYEQAVLDWLDQLPTILSRAGRKA
jgi:hypothetical protein